MCSEAYFHVAHMHFSHSSSKTGPCFPQVFHTGFHKAYLAKKPGFPHRFSYTFSSTGFPPIFVVSTWFSHMFAYVIHMLSACFPLMRLCRLLPSVAILAQDSPSESLLPDSPHSERLCLKDSTIILDIQWLRKCPARSQVRRDQQGRF